jgi:hypothetical protein
VESGEWRVGSGEWGVGSEVPENAIGGRGWTEDFAVGDLEGKCGVWRVKFLKMRLRGGGGLKILLWVIRGKV